MTDRPPPLGSPWNIRSGDGSNRHIPGVEPTVHGYYKRNGYESCPDCGEWLLAEVVSTFWWDDPEAQSPHEQERDRVERTGDWADPMWGPFHRHFAEGQVYRDADHPACQGIGRLRRVYVFDPDFLNEHERAVAQAAVKQYRAATEGST